MSTGIYPNAGYYRLAKSNSYGGYTSLANKLYIVLHYTGNKGDTAKNNVDFFATGNTRSAGAHIFVSQDGSVAQSMPITYKAYSVGDNNGGGKYKGICTNTNSISIEMCDQASKYASKAQIEAVRNIIAWIKTQCPNIKAIIRHRDVSGKQCPAKYVDDAKWKELLSAVTGGEYVVAESEFGEEWIKRLQKHYGTTVDGVISGQKKSLKKYYPAIDESCITWTGKGSELVRAIQRKYGCKEDGLLGEETIRAWQLQLFGKGSKEVDGIWGKKTSDAIKKWI